MITILRETDLQDPVSAELPIEDVTLDLFSYFSDPDKVWIARSAVIIFVKDDLFKIFKHQTTFPDNLIKPIEVLLDYIDP